MPTTNIRSGEGFSSKPAVKLRLIRTFCLLLIVVGNVLGLAPGWTAPAAVKPDPTTATFTTLLKEVIKERLLDCNVTVYANEPKKKVVQVKVLTSDTGVARQNEQNCEYESGFLFRKIFNAKVPVKMAAITFYLPSKKMAYKIVVYDMDTTNINWDRVSNIDFGSLARYVWPLPEGACTGFGQL